MDGYQTDSQWIGLIKSSLKDLDQLSKIFPSLYMWHKSPESIYVECNSRFSGICKFKNRLVIQGTTDYNIPGKASELAPIWQQEDISVSNENVARELLTIAQYADEWRIMLSTKVPLYNNRGKSLGTFGYGLELSKNIANLANLVKKSVSSKGICQGEYTLGDNFHQKAKNGTELTRRESECAFFLVRGKTIKETAQLLALSPRTVEQYVEQLRYKFSCNTKSELISMLIDEGFFDYIPKRLFYNSNHFML